MPWRVQVWRIYSRTSMVTVKIMVVEMVVPLRPPAIRSTTTAMTTTKKKQMMQWTMVEKEDGGGSITTTTNMLMVPSTIVTPQAMVSGAPIAVFPDTLPHLPCKHIREITVMPMPLWPSKMTCKTLITVWVKLHVFSSTRRGIRVMASMVKTIMIVEIATAPWPYWPRPRAVKSMMALARVPIPLASWDIMKVNYTVLQVYKEDYLGWLHDKSLLRVGPWLVLVFLLPWLDCVCVSKNAWIANVDLQFSGGRVKEGLYHTDARLVKTQQAGGVNSFRVLPAVALALVLVKMIPSRQSIPWPFWDPVRLEQAEAGPEQAEAGPEQEEAGPEQEEAPKRTAGNYYHSLVDDYTLLKVLAVVSAIDWIKCREQNHMVSSITKDFSRR